MAKADFAFRHAFRVRWSETDAQGVVFNARYLDYSDIAITEYWRAVDWRSIEPDAPMQFHVKKATVTWTAPIMPDEMIEVMARTVSIGRTSMINLVEIHGYHEDGRDDLRAEVELVSVHVDLDTHRPEPLPEWVGKVFRDYDAGASQPAMAK